MNVISIFSRPSVPSYMAATSTWRPSIRPANVWSTGNAPPSSFSAAGARSSLAIADATADGLAPKGTPPSAVPRSCANADEAISTTVAADMRERTISELLPVRVNDCAIASNSATSVHDSDHPFSGWPNRFRVELMEWALENLSAGQPRDDSASGADV